MLDHVYYKTKSLVRPLTQHRRLWERAKYIRASILSAQAGNDALRQSFGRPCATGKIGSGEMAALRHYLRRSDSRGVCHSWNSHAGRNLYRIAGVYPPEPEVLSRFCQLYIDALTDLDFLAVWFNFGEHAAWRRFASSATLTELDTLEPYYNSHPWSHSLAGKRVLVVTPFTLTIQRQYQRRKEVWKSNPGLLPDCDLFTLRVPLSSYVSKPEYLDWFAALDAMKHQMESCRFDVAIVGAGAWSLPLVAHAKRLGAWAIHLGGSTQILFGIRGRRWEKNPRIMRFCNEAWVRPSAEETPGNASAIEGGCYW